MISIIVPIYNTAAYLEKCLTSLKNQTYKNIEILLIDDGSTDESKKICLDFATQDARFHYYYKQNGGVSSARNLGIKFAKGEYLTFLDSDDFIDENMYEEMMNHFSESISFVACEVYDHKPLKKPGQYSSQAFLEGLLLGNFTMDVYSKIFRSSLFKLNNIYFPEGKLMEEGMTWPNLLISSSSVYYLTVPYYHYIYRSGSICHSKPNWNFMYILETINMYYEKLPLHFKNIVPFIDAFKYKNLILLYRAYIKQNADKQMIAYLEKLFSDCFWRALFSPYISIKLKLLCLHNLVLKFQRRK